MIVFFVNKYNDIDHTVPIAYRFAKAGYQVRVLSINVSLNIVEDFRLKFLRQQCGVHVNYLYREHSDSLLQKLFAKFITPQAKAHCRWGLREEKNNRRLWFNPLKMSAKFSDGALLISVAMRGWLTNKLKLHERKTIGRIFGKRWVFGLYKKIQPIALVFDHATWIGLANVQQLAEVGKEMQLPCFDLPHGIPMYTKHPPYWDKSKRNLIKYGREHVVLSHVWWEKELLEAGLDEKRIKVLGNTRFCSEWVSVLEKISPKSSILDELGKGKQKIIYFDAAPIEPYEASRGEVYELVSTINGLEDCFLVVKPQTRGNKASIRFPPGTNLEIDESSRNLVQWADVVIVLTSSIVVEAYVQGKPFIYPKYLNDYEMLFERYNACWPVDSLDELVDALDRLRQAPTYKPYTKVDVEALLTEIVYHGNPGADVLGEYQEYILEKTETRIIAC
jgi:hypothetical protein